MTIGVSLFIAGSILLVRVNVVELVSQWRRESRVLVYLEPGVSQQVVDRLRTTAAERPWVRSIEFVASAQAVERFKRTFPSLADLADGWSQEPLPSSLELAIDPDLAVGRDFDAWLGVLRAEPGVSMLDDDRDWLRQLEAALSVLAGIGAVLATVMLGAAVFTIASVVRLTAHLYRDEIVIMRLVGATEFYIRGPFYVEGLLQGLLGGLLAIAALQTLYLWLLPQLGGSVAAIFVAVRFLDVAEILGVIAIGGAAGLLGALVSLRREDLG